MAKKPSKPSILQQVETDLRSFLSQHQQLILNERELQLRIAQFLLNTGCYSNVAIAHCPVLTEHRLLQQCVSGVYAPCISVPNKYPQVFEYP